MKVLSENVTGVNYQAFAAALRKKDVIADGVRLKENVFVDKGVVLTVFLPDNAVKSDYSVFYEDNNLIIVNKNKGIEVCNGDYNVADELKKSGITTFPVHRIDRNTSGLCMLCKSQDALSEFITALREGRIKKFYRAEVSAAPTQTQGVFVDYMEKNAAKSLVNASKTPFPGAKKTVTRYRLLKKTSDGALLDVEICEGFTHQIRASLALHGMPIIGDGKYGNNALNRALNSRYQRLCAYKLVFDFPERSPMHYLNDHAIILPEQDIKL